MRHKTRTAYLVTLVISLFLMLISCALFVGAKETDGERAERARRALAERMIVNMDKCARIGLKMGYSGADIQFSLYPELKPLLYTLSECNTAVKNAFGGEYAPISDALMKRLNATCQALELAYASGKAASSHEVTLGEYLSLFSGLLDERFTPDGDLRAEY